MIGWLAHVDVDLSSNSVTENLGSDRDAIIELFRNWRNLSDLGSYLRIFEHSLL